MPLTTYAELKTSIASWLARDDLTSQLDDFVTIFEACANRRLLVRQMETSTTLSPSAGSVTLPTDYLSWIRVTNVGTSIRQDLEYVTPSKLQREYPTTPSGTPVIFTIEGATLKIRPTTSTSLEFEYYQKITALSGGVNWLYSTHPDLYLFGSLIEGEAFNRNPDFPNGPVIWKGRRDEIFEEIKELSRRSKSPS